MIQRPERRAHERLLAEEHVTVSGTDHDGLVVMKGTIVNAGAGGVRVSFDRTPGFDPEAAPEVVLIRSTGETRHLVLRVLAVEGNTIRAAFVDPPRIDPTEWRAPGNPIGLVPPPTSSAQSAQSAQPDQPARSTATVGATTGAVPVVGAANGTASGAGWPM